VRRADREDSPKVSTPCGMERFTRRHYRVVRTPPTAYESACHLSN